MGTGGELPGPTHVLCEVLSSIDSRRHLLACLWTINELDPGNGGKKEGEGKEGKRMSGHMPL